MVANMLFHEKKITNKIVLIIILLYPISFHKNLAIYILLVVVMNNKTIKN